MSRPSVLLELDSLTIHRPKERWQLYFLLGTEHPTEPDKWVFRVVPDTANHILVVPSQNNKVNFEPTGIGANGLFLLSRELPENNEINVHLHVMHSRKALRNVGREITELLADQGVSVILQEIPNLLGIAAATPWIVLAKSAVGLVGQALQRIPDRNMGFITMFERFGPEFPNEVEVDREARGGHVSVVYSWALNQ